MELIAPILPLVVTGLLVYALVSAVKRRTKAPADGAQAGPTKRCRECKADIPKDARRCMHCGTKQGIGLLGGIFAGLFIFMVFGWVMASVQISKTHQPTTTGEQNAASNEKNDASIMCMQAVRAAAKFPSSVDFSVFSSLPAQRLSGGGWRIYWAFESKNGFGNMIPQMATCEIIDGKMQAFHVRNR